ncbi:M-phase phosphoprotein 8 [Extremus antarcticus]|uniref:M-phase phosphoprotein 8 n=1 Tax=Extremus antarcticus TaxID=702011 RepID=A0AAJ0DJF2_9PEZI|nr:M-phase phosphoprotein 8 [Extremus antarcticus]
MSRARYQPTPVDDSEEDEADVYEVEKIVGHRTDSDGTRLYRVRWTGYSSEDDEFMYEEALESCEEVLHAYLQRTGLKRDRELIKRLGSVTHEDTGDQDHDRRISRWKHLLFP